MISGRVHGDQTGMEPVYERVVWKDCLDAGARCGGCSHFMRSGLARVKRPDQSFREVCPFATSTAGLVVGQMGLF